MMLVTSNTVYIKNNLSFLMHCTLTYYTIITIFFRQIFVKYLFQNNNFTFFIKTKSSRLPHGHFITAYVMIFTDEINAVTGKSVAAFQI